MIVITDIDHTISHARWRDSLIGGEGGWDFYHLEGDKDEPIASMIFLLKALSRHGAIIVAVTARPEKWRALTMRWLVRHKVPIDDLLMRPDNDFRPSPLVKIDLIAKHYAPDDVHFVIDDRDDIVQAYREAGYTVLQIYVP